MSKYSSADPHTQKLLTYTNTQQIRSLPPPHQITQVQSAHPHPQLTDNKSSDAHGTPTETKKTPTPSLTFTQTQDLLSPILSQQDNSYGPVNNTSQSPITDVLNLPHFAMTLQCARK